MEPKVNIALEAARAGCKELLSFAYRLDQLEIKEKGPGGINKNGHGEVFDADGNPRMSKTFVDWLKDDPRLPILAARRSDKSTAIADLIGMPNGSTGATVSDTSIYAEPNRNVITGRDAPMVQKQ